MYKLLLILSTIGVACVVADNGISKSDTRYECHAINGSDKPQLPDWGAANKKELEDIVAERREYPEKLIDVVAYRGKPLQEYRWTLRDMNSMMRTNYAEMIERIGRNIYPLIIATDAEPGFAGVGSTYTLYLADGTSKRIAPTSPEYEMYKDLGHMALGVFSIISPYFYTPTSQGWHDKLRQYQDIVRRSLDAAQHSGLKNHSTPCRSQQLTVDDQIAMLSLVHEYIGSCFESGSVDFAGYRNFTATFTPYVQRVLSCAAELQVNASIPALKQWKDELGPKLWRDLYVLIPVIWPVARRNVREEIFETLMDADRVRTHILKTENVKDFEEARTTLGRIVGDRTLADLVFGMAEPSKTELNLALSTRRDLVASEGEKAINKYMGTSNNEIVFDSD